MINLNKKYNLKTKQRKQLEKLEKKYKSGYLYKMWTFRIAIVLVVAIIGYSLVTKVKWISDIEDVDITALNASTYSEEIAELYNRDSEKEKFEEYINSLEQAIAMYLINNTTIKEGSFEDMVKEAEKIVNKNDWSVFKLTKDEYYNGKYYISKDGNVSFKFANKKIEPNWASSLEKVILN